MSIGQPIYRFAVARETINRLFRGCARNDKSDSVHPRNSNQTFEQVLQFPHFRLHGERRIGNIVQIHTQHAIVMIAG